MNQVDIDRVQMLCDKASPGPWSDNCTNAMLDKSGRCVIQYENGAGSTIPLTADQDFIVSARQLVPYLLGEVAKWQQSASEWADGHIQLGVELVSTQQQLEHANTLLKALGEGV